jgi:YVTN family beta-propeller protein
MKCRPAIFAVAAMAVLCPASVAAGALVPDGTIALPDTSGRIDHMSVDPARKRLFVAELGNGSVDVIDLASRKVIHRITGLDEPQGVVYVPKTDVLAVASGGDGTVRLYDGNTFALRGTIALGDDADNARAGPGDGEVTVGNGSGSLAIIDTEKARKASEVGLAKHPEAFQLAPAENRAFVNVPDAGRIAVVDLKTGKQIASWSPPGLSSPFPMALGPAGDVTVVFRGQSKLAVFDESNGRLKAATETCGDADDVFFDARRQRYYVSCGEGVIDVFDVRGPERIAQIATSSGARTSLFVPELDRLYVAARAGLLFGSNAGILIFKPVP